MNLFKWGERRFARGIARAMIRSYKLHKAADPTLNEFELVKNTLADRPGEPARNLLGDIKDIRIFMELGGNLFGITYILVLLEYMEYMKATLDTENEQTNIIFKNTIQDEFCNNPY